MINYTFAASLLGTALLLTACKTTDPAPHNGSYAAARHMRVGSNIPQPDSVNDMSTTGSTTDMERAGAATSRMSMGSMAHQ